MIRSATDSDIPDLLAMAERFHSASGPCRKIPFDRESVETAMRGLLNMPGKGAIFVLTHGDRLVGMIGGAIVPSYVNKDVLIATELAWWIDPPHRTGIHPIRLMRAFEDWARSNWAKFVGMGIIETASPAALTAFYERLDYTCTERTFVKEL